MFEIEKKNLIIGIIGTILSAGLAAIFYVLYPKVDWAELDFYGMFLRIGFMVFMAAALGCFFCIFSGIKFALAIFGIFVGMFAFLLLLIFISKVSLDIAVLLIVSSAIVVLLIIAYRDYKKNRYNINGDDALSHKERKRQEELEELLEELEEEDKKFNQSINYLEKSIILSTQISGALYQVVKTDTYFLFHHVGSQLKGVDTSKLISDFSNVNDYKDDKKDYIIKYSDIDNIKATIRDNYSMMDFGVVKITLDDGKSKKYSLVDDFNAGDLKKFFGENISLTDKINNVEEVNISKADADNLNKLNDFIFAFKILSYFVYGVYFMVNDAVVQAVLTTLCIAICIVPFILFIAFPKYVIMEDEPRNGGIAQKGKVSVLGDAMLSTMLFALISLLKSRKFISYDWVNLLIYSCILFGVLILIILLATKNNKKSKSAVAMIVVCLLLLSPVIVHNIDYAYDFLDSQEISCQIVDMPTKTDNDGDVSYYLLIKYKDGEIKVEVSKETYEQYKTNDDILVVVKQGLLGIEKAMLKK